jgi:hypothetical protein
VDQIERSGIRTPICMCKHFFSYRRGNLIPIRFAAGKSEFKIIARYRVFAGKHIFYAPAAFVVISGGLCNPVQNWA